MGEIIIEDVFLTPLKRIHHSKGDIFHGIKKSDKGFSDFGEAYFSTITNGEIKGWNKHSKMILNLIVPMGEVIFVLYDNRENSISKGSFLKVVLSPSNYLRLTVPPGLWMAFKGNCNDINLILNVASIEHDPDEIDRLDLNEISFNWESN